MLLLSSYLLEKKKVELKPISVHYYGISLHLKIFVSRGEPVLYGPFGIIVDVMNKNVGMKGGNNYVPWNGK